MRSFFNLFGQKNSSIDPIKKDVGSQQEKGEKIAGIILGASGAVEGCGYDPYFLSAGKSKQTSKAPTIENTKRELTDKEYDILFDNTFNPFR